MTSTYGRSRGTYPSIPSVSYHEWSTSKVRSSPSFIGVVYYLTLFILLPRFPRTKDCLSFPTSESVSGLQIEVPTFHPIPNGPLTSVLISCKVSRRLGDTDRPRTYRRRSFTFRVRHRRRFILSRSCHTAHPFPVWYGPETTVQFRDLT